MPVGMYGPVTAPPGETLAIAGFVEPKVPTTHAPPSGPTIGLRSTAPAPVRSSIGSTGRSADAVIALPPVGAINSTWLSRADFVRTTTSPPSGRTDGWDAIPSTVTGQPGRTPSRSKA